ncbi:MAG: T9SS type A sorting domain-containing protein, partial [Flavobacteriales bacterium]|nr:T9SS type A sorting domain-containing protein [Flavobacteriales bacterium]
GIQGSKYKVQSITFIDMLGYAELYLKTTANENNINISHLANGIYTVVATTEDGETHRQRLVVQH